MRLGLEARQLSHTTVESIRQAEIRNFNRANIGHGIGLTIHEAPNMTASSSAILEENVVLNIETPYHCIGIGTFQQEDTVRITKTGPEPITNFDRDVRLYA